MRTEFDIEFNYRSY